MIQNKISVLFILPLLFLACGTGKQVTEVNPKPSWVQNKPVSPTYYTGIGSALKTVNVNEYQTTAKNNALADLASEISVNISTTSALHQFENTYGYAEDFQSDIKTQSAEQLEGFELVNTYENETNYWVYYRLSKEKHRKLKEQRESEAKAIGLDYFNKAEQSRENNKHINAFSYYIKGLEAIKLYLSESLETEYENKQIYLGNELISRLMSLINNMQVIPENETITVKKSQSVPSNALSFKIIDNDGDAVVGVPVVFYLNKRPLRNNKTQSNELGAINYVIESTKGPMGVNHFTAQVDLEQIARTSTNDILIRKLMRKVEPPVGIINLVVQNPSFYVQSVEKNLNEELFPKIIEPKVSQILSNSKYPVVFEPVTADYRLEISSNTQPEGVNGKFHYSTLTGTVKVFNNQGQLILLKPIEDIQGVQLNYKEAGIDAYEKLQQYLERNLIPKLAEAIK